MDRETVNVADLRLDSENPRHDPTKGQREIIDALLEKEGLKIVHLAEDIAEFGISPIDDLLVLKSGGSYTVLEGNRRLAALKLLGNPALTRVPKYEKRIRAIKKTTTAPAIHELEVAIVKTRAEGRHWQELRHTGERGGRSVIRWDAEASARFYGRRGSHSDTALAIIDALEPAYPNNKDLLAGLKEIRKSRLTTVGRLLSDPAVRARLGIEMKPEVGAHYTSEQLEPAITRIVTDFSTGKVTVSGIWAKEDRRKYLLKIRAELPDEGLRDPDARPLVPAGSPRPPAPKPPKTKPGPQPSPAPKPLFDGVQLTNLGGRIADVLTELQKLDVDKYPNAAGALLRVVIELAVTEVHERKNWPTTNVKLKELVKKCLRALDPTEKDPKYQSVRAGLNDGSSMFAVATIHAYLHNQYYNPTPSEIRSTSSNYAAFLAGLDTLV